MQVQPAQRKPTADEQEAESPFAGLQTTSIVREVRIFSQPQLNAQKCCKVLTKILYLLNQGETFTKEETTEVFFSCTKLFQSQESSLRRLTYLAIKELQIPSDESLIVVSCLSKDMTSKTDLFRANAIRVLAKIMDPAMVTQVERFLKQAIVDANPFIVSSTLVAGQHLFATCPEIVKRWANEVQVALTNKAKSVQYQALALLYKIKQNDRLATSKVVSSLARNPPKGSLAQCLHIRIVAQTLEQSQSPTPDPELIKYLTECLHSKNYMVTYEAARTMCRLKNLPPTFLPPAISAMQEFLVSVIPAQKFAAVRTLSEVVTRHPLVVSPICTDLEHLITDSNRNIATLAITTLLKTGLESSVDRLMKSITGFMAEITDDFKMVLVDAVKTLCLKFKHKHSALMNFLALSLREEGGYPFKLAIVDGMNEIIDAVPEAKETGLEQYCEFIEDCEFPELTIKILYILGEKGPKTSKPATFVRFIFNRIILETAAVRAASVTALARFGVQCPNLTEDVCILLKRCLYDSNDEVRDRAILYHSTLRKYPPKVAKGMLFPKQTINLKDLEASLIAYLEKPQTEPFDTKKIVASTSETKTTTGTEPTDIKTPPPDIKSPTPDEKGGSNSNRYATLLQSIPEIKELGPIWKSSEPVNLTESETEYVVTCVKHTYPGYVLFQFNVTNKMEDQLLENVTVEMECEKEDWVSEFVVPETQLKYGVAGVTFVALQRPEKSFSSGSIACTLNFFFKDVDTSSGEVDQVGVEDQYQLEELEVKEGDFMRTSEDIGLVEFRRQWETLGDSSEAVKRYSLGLETLQAAADAVVELLGMTACEKSGKVADGARSHTVNLTGTYFGDIPVLARAAFLLDTKPAVTLKVAVRSKDSYVNQLLVNSIR